MIASSRFQVLGQDALLSLPLAPPSTRAIHGSVRSQQVVCGLHDAAQNVDKKKRVKN